VTGVRTILRLFVLAGALLTACSRPRQYELRGQVLAVDRTRQELTLKHEDIRGFMPGMTMPFKVKDPRLLDGQKLGDLVQATLVVQDANAYLSSVTRTGHADLTEAPPAPRVELLAPGQRVPDLGLTDETGARHALSDWRGRVVAVTFMYTRCPLPDFCPRIDQQFKAAQAEILADAGTRDRYALLSVSFDPAFDTPTVLAAHARKVGADPRIWRFVTGDRDTVAGFASLFGTAMIRDGSTVDSVTHNLRTAVIASDGTLLTVLRGNESTPAELMRALRQAH
jgi:protein SCO1